MMNNREKLMCKTAAISPTTRQFIADLLLSGSGAGLGYAAGATIGDSVDAPGIGALAGGITGGAGGLLLSRILADKQKQDKIKAQTQISALKGKTTRTPQEEAMLAALTGAYG